MHTIYGTHCEAVGTIDGMHLLYAWYALRSQAYADTKEIQKILTTLSKNDSLNLREF